MNKKARLEKLNNQLSQIQAEIDREKLDSEKPTNEIKVKVDKGEMLDKVLDEIQEKVKELSDKYSLTYFELFGVLKVLELELAETSRE